MSKSTDWHSDTALIRSGINRTGNQETSEALFMTSGYVYDTAEQAAAAFGGDAGNFVYSRHGNPTLFSLEKRLPELASRQMSGSSTLIAFEVKGGRIGAFRFLNALKVIDISNNLGDSKSLACHPSSTTHMNLSEDERQMLEIKEGHIRLLVGLEHADDLTADMQQPFDVRRGF